MGWHAAQYVVQIYNTKLIPKAEFPKTYQDLLDPKWKGKLGIEAEDVDWFGTVVKEMGEEKGLKLFRDWLPPTVFRYARDTRCWPA